MIEAMPRSRRSVARPDHECAPRDSVDALMASWVARQPALDFSAVGVIARVARVKGQIDAELDRVFAAHGLGAATFAVLVTLARIDAGDGVSQRRLMDELGLTSGTISVRMDRLVKEGLVGRRPDPESRRSTLISLTPAGRELFERVVPAHLTNGRRLLAALDDDEQDLLAALLRKLLVEFEGSRPPADARLRLGLALAPAHAAIGMRESVGLPPVAGLLVRGVEADGPAGQAGVRLGDVLVASGGRELRSISALYAAIDDVAAGRSLPLRLWRGAEEVATTVRLGAAGFDGASASTGGRGAGGEHRV
jgi:DNA-binding MarR family transcriptional regulator